MPHRRERERDREARDTWDNCLYKIACAGSAILVLYLALTVVSIFARPFRAGSLRAYPEEPELWSLAPSLVSSATTNSTARSHLTQLRLPSTNQTQEVSKVKGVPSLRLVGFIDASSNHSLVYPDVPGVFVALDAEYEPPGPDSQYHKGPDKSTKSCEKLAREAVEPLTSYHEPRAGPPQPLFGSVPRSFYQWPGNITLEQFRSVPANLRGPSCIHCVYTVRYKVYKGALYRDAPEPKAVDQTPSEEMMLLALHLFDLPDADLIIHYGDGCPPDGRPVISWNICRQYHHGGFTMPSYDTWRTAIGPYQTEVLHSCYATRYPADKRSPVVIWRGTTTDTRYTEFNEDNWLQASRIKAHMMTRDSKGFDVKLSNAINIASPLKLRLGQLGSYVPIEDFNLNTVVLDFDGNGWSERFARLTHFNTPILKQASNFTAFFEHLVAPGYMVEHFANDLNDLMPRGKLLLSEWQANRRRLVRQATRRQGLAAALLNNVALIEAMAYTMSVYASKITWKVGVNADYTLVPFDSVCKDNTFLPVELCKAAAARKPPTMRELLAGGHEVGPI